MADPHPASTQATSQVSETPADSDAATADARHRSLAAPEERGTTTIADRVVERVASLAANEVDDVTDGTSGWTRIVRRSTPRAEARVAGGRARIKVEIAAAWPASLPALATTVSERVTRRVAELTGVAVDGVDVTIADVVHSQSPRRRVE